MALTVKKRQAYSQGNFKYLVGGGDVSVDPLSGFVYVNVVRLCTTCGDPVYVGLRYDRKRGKLSNDARIKSKLAHAWITRQVRALLAARAN